MLVSSFSSRRRHTRFDCGWSSDVCSSDLAMAIFLLGLVRCFEEYPRVSIASAAITGAGFGLSFGSRIMGVFGVLDALAALALIFMFECYARGIRSAGGRLGQLGLTLGSALPPASAGISMGLPLSARKLLDPLRA